MWHVLLGRKKVDVHHLSTCTAEMTGEKIFAYEEWLNKLTIHCLATVLMLKIARTLKGSTEERIKERLAI